MLNKDINLLPIGIIETREKQEKTRLIFLTSVISIILIAAIIATLYSNIEQLNSKKKDLEKRLAQYTDMTGTGLIAQGDQDKSLYLQNVLAKIQGQEYDNTLFLSLLEEEVPESSVINSIIVTGNEITINAIAPDEEIIANFIYNIRNLDNINGVYLSNITDTGKNNKSFSLRCTRTRSSLVK